MGAIDFFTLGVFYGMQSEKGATRIVIIALLICFMQATSTLSQLISPSLYFNLLQP